MKKATDSEHTDQVYTASKPQDPSKPPSPMSAKRKSKSTMGPGTRAKRNERFGEEVS